MKTRTVFLILGSLLIFFSCQEDPGKEIGALHLSKQYPQPGDSIDLSYQLGEIDEETEIKAFYEYFVSTKSYPVDLNFTTSEGILKAVLVIPDSATAIAFNFNINGIVDNNEKKGYFLPLYNSNGERLAGSRANEGFFYWGGYQYEVQSDSALAEMEEDLQLNPHLENEWEDYYSRLLYESDKKKAEIYMNKRIRFYTDKENLTDDDYYILARFYNTMDNKKTADSVLKIGRDNHPGGRVSEWYYSNKFREEKDNAKREAIFKEFQEKMNGRNGSGINYFSRTLAANNAENKNWEKFEFYTGLITDKRSLGRLLNRVAGSLAEKGEDLEKAEELSERSLESLSGLEKSEYSTVKQHERSLKFSESMFLDTYSTILFKLGKLDKAIENQEKAVAVGDGKNSEYNERYLQYLLTNEEYVKAEITGAEFISSYNATSKAKDYYRVAFKKAKGSEEGLDRRLEELRQLGYKKALGDTRKKMLNEEAPDFELADLEGNIISLKSLRGKTVILDFWATWCGPCLTAFPGMQMAVNKFEEDDSVQFLFVNTYEKGPDLNNKVSKLLKTNNYSFHVLMDEQMKGTDRFKTAYAYNVLGIPTTVFIGPDGKLRFKNVGSNGNNEQMVEEISIMIDLLKLPAEAPAKKEPVTSL